MSAMIFKCKVSNFRPSREAIFSILHSPKSKSCSYKKRKRQPSVTSSLLPFKMSCLFFLPPCVNNGNDTRKEKDNLKARIWADNKMGGSRHFWARLSRKRSRDVESREEPYPPLRSSFVNLYHRFPFLSPKIRKKRNHSWMTKEVEERQRNKGQEKMSRMRQQHKRQVPSSESRKITLRDITDRRRTQDTRITRETERMITSSRIQQ